MSWLRTCALLGVLTLVPLRLAAQGPTGETTIDGVDGEAYGDGDTSSTDAEPQPGADSPAANRELQVAEQAIEDERWDDALQALERAYLADADAYYLYRRILVLEEMGEVELALTVLTENRTELASNERVNDVALIEERLRAAMDNEDVADVNGEQSDSSEPVTVRPSVPLLVGGGVLVVGGVALFIVGTSRARAVRCSASARPADCASTSDLAPLSADEFERRGAGANALFATGIALTAAGVAAGVLAFVLKGNAEQGVSMFVTPSGYIGLRARW